MKITLEIKMQDELTTEELARWVADCADKKIAPEHRLAQIIRSTIEGQEEAA